MGVTLKPVTAQVTPEEAARQTRAALLFAFAEFAEGCEVCRESAHSQNAYFYGIQVAVIALGQTDPERRAEAAALLYDIAERWMAERELLNQTDGPVV
jgi:hypothetical protein